MKMDLRSAAQKLLLFMSFLGNLVRRRNSTTPVDRQPSMPPLEYPESLIPGQTESTAKQAMDLTLTVKDEEQSPERSSSEEPRGVSQKPLGLMDMLWPVGACLTIFNSVLQARTAAEKRHEEEEPLLFVLLVDSIVMGFFSSFIGFFYALFKKKEGSGRTQPPEVERIKFKWLMAGWLFTVIAVVLWILLHLPEKILWKVLPAVAVGSVSLVLFFWAL